MRSGLALGIFSILTVNTLFIFGFLQFAGEPDNVVNRQFDLYNYDLTLGANSNVHRYLFVTPIHGYDNKLGFECFVEETKEEISQVEFCCQTPQNSDVCSTISSADESFTCAKITFSVAEFSKTKGAKLQTVLPKNEESNAERSCTLSCKIKRGDSIVESNGIQLFDAKHYANQLNLKADLSQEDIIGKKTASDFPLRLQCLSSDEQKKMEAWPEWLQVMPKRLLPFSYIKCDIKGKFVPGDCVPGNNRESAISSSEGTLDASGAFYVTDANFFAQPRAILCINAEGSVVKSFLSEADNKDAGIIVDASVRPTAFRAISAPEQSMQLYDGTDFGKDGFSLTALYEKPADALFAWQKDGVAIASGTYFGLFVAKRVNEEHAGSYELTVHRKDDPEAKLTFKFHVNVVGPPHFHDAAKCLASRILVAESQTLKVACKAEKALRMLVGVNGHEADSAEAVQKLLSDVYGTQSAHPLSRMRLWFTTVGGEFLIRAKEMARRQDFRLGLEATNDFGKSLIHGFVSVIPKPMLATKPSDLSCERECDSSPQTIEVALREEFLTELKERKVDYVVDWLINERHNTRTMESHRLSDFVELDPRNPLRITLFLKGAKAKDTAAEDPRIARRSAANESVTTPSSIAYVEDAQSLPELLQIEDPYATSVRVLARIRIFTTDKSVAVHRDEAITDKAELDLPDKIVLYDSMYEQNEQLRGDMTAQLAFPPRFLAQGSYTWVVIIVILVIVLLVLAIMGITLLYVQRKKGSVYAIHDSEKKAGLDPDNDLAIERQFTQPRANVESTALLSETLQETEEDLEVYNSENMGKIAAKRV